MQLRAESDITLWIEYFLEGMVYSFGKVIKQMEESNNKGGKDLSALIRKLDPKQRKALELFKSYETITSHQIGELFGVAPRTQTNLCKKWSESGFLEIIDPSYKARKYALAQHYRKLIE